MSPVSGGCTVCIRTRVENGAGVSQDGHEVGILSRNEPSTERQEARGAIVTFDVDVILYMSNVLAPQVCVTLDTP